MKWHYLNTTGIKSLLLLIALSTPAYAGWQGTEWGMSEAEVQRVFPDVVVGGNRLGLAEQNISDGVASVVFLFGEGLEQINVLFLDDMCLAYVERDLLELYGMPISRRESRSGLEMTWLDAANDNRIHYAWVGLTCRITYSRLPKKGEPGGL